MAGLQERLYEVRQRIHQACQRSGRDPSTVTLVGVTKGVPGERIEEAVAAGVSDIGENRVQEARDKQIALGSRLKAVGRDVGLRPSASGLQPVRWHLIGHLQRNKARLAVELFDVIHSVDSLALIQELERHAAKHAARFTLQDTRQEPHKYLEVLIQVNIASEETKFGCRPEDAASLAEAIIKTDHLRLVGLMTLAPFAEDPKYARPVFRRLRELRKDVAVACSLQPAALKLSMGMSHDFEAAIEEGADVVRIGTALFGERDQVIK